MKRYKTLIECIWLLAGFISSSVQAEATAVADVTARVVPVVSAAMTGSVILSGAVDAGTVATDRQQDYALIQAFATTDAAATFYIRSAGRFAYDVSVSSSVKTSDSQGNELTLKHLEVPVGEQLTSDQQKKLHLRAVMGQVQKAGHTPYTGSVDVTVNFN